MTGWWSFAPTQIAAGGALAAADDVPRCAVASMAGTALVERCAS
jgi:hypothetical protein